ncbi:hypothetical protein [Streptomyces ochraceiscleroticus]|uniref:DUF317 domain-containing protein n=1 Tax=Streptomyces ochraceiscleroticus TaxID=47761 RepID=A0ABW1MD05_9ACTN|nr:hypothetical protein [Streptomyces ochraceiscleroticus]
MPSQIANRPPQELGAELWSLTGLNWDVVWAGVPAEETARREWCAAFGWQPLWFEAGQYVRTRQGGKLRLGSVAYGRPVTRVDYTSWAVRSTAVEENARLTEALLERWQSCLAAATTVLGPPTWSGAWDTEGFPDLPGRGFDGSDEWRLQHQDPHRLALWSFRTPGAPLFSLRANLGAGIATGQGLGEARISLVCHGPEDPDDQGPGWLL